MVFKIKETDGGKEVPITINLYADVHGRVIEAYEDENDEGGLQWYVCVREDLYADVVG